MTGSKHEQQGKTRVGGAYGSRRKSEMACQALVESKSKSDMSVHTQPLAILRITSDKVADRLGTSDNVKVVCDDDERLLKKGLGVWLPLARR